MNPYITPPCERRAFNINPPIKIRNNTNNVSDNGIDNYAFDLDDDENYNDGDFNTPTQGNEGNYLMRTPCSHEIENISGNKHYNEYKTNEEEEDILPPLKIQNNKKIKIKLLKKK
jgi:hypothetical protein